MVAKEAKQEDSNKETKTKSEAQKKETKSTKASSKSPLTKEQIKEGIKALPVVELSELVKELEEEWGVSAAAPAVAVQAAAAPSQEAAPVEEQTEFDVVIKEAGDKKIQVIKVVREVTSLGLKEAKAVVDNAPGPVKEKVSKEQAEEIKSKLEAVGATVEVK